MEELSITPQIAKFKEHLDIKENHRIIFSGRFGSGKTYFLKKFFKEKSDKYIQIRLTPVNYVVASNQDIFELIKFDILFELLKLDHDLDHKIFEKSEIEALIKLPYFIDNNIYDFAKFLVDKGGLVGENIVKISKILIDLVDFIEKYADLKSKFKKFGSIDEKKKVLQYLQSFESKEGSLHEQDQFTNLIYNCIEKLKQGLGNPKEVILVIDDLDRIDPEHIFRLFNIFSAHIDFEMTDKTVLRNKFGFDKIVFVCDIDNIRNIYHAKYGANVDFSGYIDKFYSKEVFMYDIRSGLRNIISNYINKLDISIYDAHIRHYANKDVLVYILESLVVSNSLNIRTLEQRDSVRYSMIPYETNLQFSINNGASSRGVESNELQIFSILDFLVKVIGHPHGVYEAISIASNTKIFLKQEVDERLINKAIGLLIPVLLLRKQMNSIPERFEGNVTIEDLPNEYIKFVLDDRVCKIFDRNTNKNFFNLLKMTLDVLRERYGMYK